MIKVIAILLNIIFLGWLGYMCAKEEIEIDWVSLFLFLLPVFNLIALILGKDLWITLYFKRKALEEKKKIAEIEKEIEKDGLN